MPLPKGSRRDPLTGKMIMPEGYIKKSEAERAKHKSPSSAPTGAGARFERERAAARGNFAYRLFVCHPSGDYYLGDMHEPSYEFIANNYGGGKFKVWRFDKTTREYAGDPAEYNVDPNVFPLIYNDPTMARRPMVAGQPFGGGGFFPGAPQGMFGGSGMPMPMPPLQQQSGKAEDLEDLEEDLEEAENKIASLQLALASKDRELAEIRQAQALAEIERKNEAARAEMKSLIEKLSGGKDPLTQLLDFKRVEAELNGGVIGKGGSGIAEAMSTAMGLVNVIMTASKSITSEGGGNGFDTILRMLDKYAPIIAKAAEGSPMGPKPRVVDEKAAPSQPQPQAPPPTPPQPGPELKAFKQALENMPTFQASEPAGFADWICVQNGEGWPELQTLLRTEKPEAFLESVNLVAPPLADTEEKKKWILQAAQTAQMKLLNAKAK